MKKGTEEEKREQELQQEPEAKAEEQKAEKPADEVAELKNQIQKLESEKAEMKDHYTEYLVKKKIKNLRRLKNLSTL